MHPHIEQLLGSIERQTEAAGSVLAVGDHQIDGMPVHQAVQFPGERLAARLADDIPYKQNLNWHKAFQLNGNGGFFARSRLSKDCAEAYP